MSNKQFIQRNAEMNLKLDNIKRKKYLWDVEQLSFLWFCKSSTKQGPQLRFKKKKRVTAFSSLI